MSFFRKRNIGSSILDGEVIAARGAKENLDARLDDIDTQINTLTLTNVGLSDVVINVKDYGVLGNGSNETATIQSAIDLVPEGGVIYFPQGTYYVDGLIYNKNILFKGAGSIRTVLKHRDGNACALIRNTNDNNGEGGIYNAVPCGGFSSMTLYAGTLTTDILYFDGQVDNQMIFYDLQFHGITVNTIVNGFSMRDFLNLSLDKVRFDYIGGYGIKIRDALAFSMNYFNMTNWTYDNGGGNIGKGILYANTKNKNKTKGVFSFKDSRIEINSKLQLKDLIRIEQFDNTSSDVDNTNHIQNIVNIENVVLASKDLNVTFIKCDVGYMGINIKNFTTYGIKQIYNNDASTAINNIYCNNNHLHTYNISDSCTVRSNKPSVTRKHSILGTNIYKNPDHNLANIEGMFKTGDIIYPDTVYSTSMGNVFGARVLGRTIGDIYSKKDYTWLPKFTITAGSNSGTLSNWIANVSFNNVASVGVGVILQGAGTAGGDLHTVITDIDFDLLTATFKHSAITSVTEGTMKIDLVDFLYVPMVRYSATMPTFNGNTDLYHKGDIYLNPNPNVGDYTAWIMNQDGSTFTGVNQLGVKKNTTANRPSTSGLSAGYMYFDTTLSANGKPIWWTGTNWVDATGTIV